MRGIFSFCLFAGPFGLPQIGPYFFKKPFRSYPATTPTTHTTRTKQIIPVQVLRQPPHPFELSRLRQIHRLYVSRPLSSSWLHLYPGSSPPFPHSVIDSGNTALLLCVATPHGRRTTTTLTALLNRFASNVSQLNPQALNWHGQSALSCAACWQSPKALSVINQKYNVHKNNGSDEV